MCIRDSIYGSPLRGDKQVISGESGSVTLGLVHAIMTRPEYKDLKEALELDENSEVLLVSSEGDTDPVSYTHLDVYKRQDVPYSLLFLCQAL